MLVGSLEMFWVTSDLPVDKALQVVEHHMLVGLYLLIGKDNSEVDSGHVHSVLVLNRLSQPLQVKVML